MPNFQVYTEGKPPLCGREIIKRKGERKTLACLSNVLTDGTEKQSQNSLGQKTFAQKRNKKKKEDVPIDIAVKGGFFSFMLEEMKKREMRQGIRGNYMKKQSELSHHMRYVLIDWLVDVSMQFTCAPEVIFVTVNYLDRFLSLMAVTKERLQLLGLTCLNIAWKYEDANNRPNLHDLVYYTDNSCTYQEVVKMEQLVVQTLAFNLNTATPLHFFNAFLQKSPLPIDHLKKAHYLLESCLMDEACSMNHTGSKIAAAVLYTFKSLLTQNSWCGNMCMLTGYTMLNLKGTLEDVMKLERRLPLSEAVKNKHTIP